MDCLRGLAGPSIRWGEVVKRKVQINTWHPNHNQQRLQNYKRHWKCFCIVWKWSKLIWEVEVGTLSELLFEKWWTTRRVTAPLNKVSLSYVLKKIKMLFFNLGSHSRWILFSTIWLNCRSTTQCQSSSRLQYSKGYIFTSFLKLLCRKLQIHLKIEWFKPSDTITSNQILLK